MRSPIPLTGLVAAALGAELLAADRAAVVETPVVAGGVVGTASRGKRLSPDGRRRWLAGCRPRRPSVGCGAPAPGCQPKQRHPSTPMDRRCATSSPRVRRRERSADTRHWRGASSRWPALPVAGGQATRQRLLDATSAAVAEGRYRDLTVVDVSRRAETSPATFYQYFPDIESAVLSLLGRTHGLRRPSVAHARH